MTTPTTEPVQPVEEKHERKAAAIAEKLDISLPKTKLPVPAKILGILMILGGLSVSGTFLTDTILGRGLFVAGVFRVLVGVLLAFIGYGLIHRRLLVLVGFAVVTVVAAFFNPVSLILTLPILVYLIVIRHFLRPGMLGRWLPFLRHDPPETSV